MLTFPGQSDASLPLVDRATLQRPIEFRSSPVAVVRDFAEFIEKQQVIQHDYRSS